MATVLVVGAGATLSQAHAFRAKRTREHPPLDRTFFEKASELAETDESLDLSIGVLRQELRESGMFPDPWSVPTAYSLEQFFADVYYEVASGRSSEAFDVLKALLRLYIRVLSMTTNWMAVRRDEGPLGKLIRLELEGTTANEVTVVTFNQDLALENIVARLPRLGERWCLPGLYGNAQMQIISRRGPYRFPHHRPECEHEIPFRLLKLHGWLSSLESDTDSIAADPRFCRLKRCRCFS
jgi:hypothetical protein